MTRWLLTMLIVAGCRKTDALESWLLKWEAARECMVGTPEYGPDTATAVAVAALVRDSDCFEYRLPLTLFHDEQTSQFPDWNALHQDIDRVGDRSSEASAIDRIDTRVNALRDRAGMPAVQRARRRPVASLATGTTIEIAGRPLARPSALTIQPGQILAEVASGTSRLHVEIDAVDAVHTMLVPVGDELAYPSRAWSATTDRGSTFTVTELEEPRRVRSYELPGAFAVARAMDAGRTRVVYLQSMDCVRGFAVAISKDNGAHWEVRRSPDPLPLVSSSQDLATGAVDIVTRSSGNAYFHRFTPGEPARFPTPVELDRYEHYFECRRDGVLWAADHHKVHNVAFPRYSSFDFVEPTTRIADCRGTSALVLSRGQHDELELCRGDGCKTVFAAKHTFYGAAALLEDGTWIYAAIVDGIVGVWREKTRATPSFYRLAAADSDVEALVAIAVLRATPYLVIVDSGGVYRLVAIAAASPVQAP